MSIYICYLAKAFRMYLHTYKNMSCGWLRPIHSLLLRNRKRAEPQERGRRTPPRIMPIAHASRRGRDLWEVVNSRLVAMIRVRRAMQSD